MVSIKMLICAKMFDEAIVDVGGGKLVKLPELSARLNVGDRGDVRVSKDAFCHLIDQFDT